MSWENELKEEIKFTTPSAQKQDNSVIGNVISSVKSAIQGNGTGGVFTALWKDNDRTMERKLGMFDPPNINGTIVQDLGAKSWMYPLTIFFDGLNHNKTAERFAQALEKESGIWKVDHPVKGELPLMLVSVKEIIAPVANGAYTGFDMVWIRPAQAQKIVTSQNLLDKISSAINDIEDALTIAQQLKADAYSAIQSATNTFNSVTGIIDSIMSLLVSGDDIIRFAYDSAVTAYNAAIDLFGLDDSDPTDVYNASIDIITAPTQATEDFSTGYTAFKNLSDGIIENSTASPDLDTASAIEENINKYKVEEFYLIIVFVNMCKQLLNSTFETRPQVVSAIENVKIFFDSLIEQLDAMQEAFTNLPVKDQLFTQTKTYMELYNIYGDVLRYLFLQFYNLSSEKIITLKKDRSPLEITVTEYGELGEDDFYYDLLIKSNKLSGNDILILRTGTEVVIYV